VKPLSVYPYRLSERPLLTVAPFIITILIFNIQDRLRLSSVFLLYFVFRSDESIFISVLIINQLDALISHIYFWNETLHVSDSSSVHH